MKTMLKVSDSTKADKKLYDAILRMIGDHTGPDASKERILAIASQVVGQILAMQDQRKHTPATMVELVQANIEKGNADFVAMLMKSDGKTPPFIN